MKKIFKIIAVLCFALFIIITYASCGGKSSVVSKEGYYMDTICRISVYDMKGMSEKKAKRVIGEAFDLCGEYESLISVSAESSDIYRINHAKGLPVECDPRTIEVIRMGIEDGDLSGGKFDITIGKVTALWDFHAEKPRVPGRDEIEKALSTVDYHNIVIEGNRVTLKNPESEIDLGGVGKGYIGDRAADFLKSKGVTDAIVDFGGNIIAIGDKNGQKFKVGVEKPYSERSEIVGYFEAGNKTLVTSGVYERYFEAGGKKYHHIIDVDTGYPADTDVVSVTIEAPIGCSGKSDGLSTVCLLLGSREGLKLVESMDGVEALFQTKDGKLIKTGGLDNFVRQK